MGSDWQGPRYTDGVEGYPAAPQHISEDRRTGGDLVATIVGLIVLALCTLSGALIAAAVETAGGDGSREAPSHASVLTQTLPLTLLGLAAVGSVLLRWRRREAFWVPVAALLATVLSWSVGMLM